MSDPQPAPTGVSGTGTPRPPSRSNGLSGRGPTTGYLMERLDKLGDKIDALGVSLGKQISDLDKSVHAQGVTLTSISNSVTTVEGEIKLISRWRYILLGGWIVAAVIGGGVIWVWGEKIKAWLNMAVS